MAMEQLVDLPALYASREFADLTIVALNGEEFHVHRVVLGQHSRLKTLILDAERDNRRVAFMESADSLRLMVRWMYGVPWPGLTENTTKGRAQELKSMVEIAHAAEKVSIHLYYPSRPDTSADRVVVWHDSHGKRCLHRCW